MENSISEAARRFHMDALSSMAGLKADSAVQLTWMASGLYRLTARRIGRECKRAHNGFVAASGWADRAVPMPWFGNKQLRIRFA